MQLPPNTGCDRCADRCAAARFGTQPCSRMQEHVMKGMNDFGRPIEPCCSGVQTLPATILLHTMFIVLACLTAKHEFEEMDTIKLKPWMVSLLCLMIALPLVAQSSISGVPTTSKITSTQAERDSELHSCGVLDDYFNIIH